MWPVAYWDRGFEFCQGHGCLCCACCRVKTKGKRQDNQNKETSTLNVQRQNNPGEGKISSTRPDRSWGPPRVLYDVYRVSFPGVKLLGRGFIHPPHLAKFALERAMKVQRGNTSIVLFFL